MVIIKTIAKKIIWNIKGGYRPKRFWEEWGKTFVNDSYQRGIYQQHWWILKKINEIEPENILEVGCGFGRNIRFLVDNKFPAEKITGIDISSTMIKQAKKYLVNKKVKLIEADIVNLPFRENEFFLTLSHGVLMHVAPKDIDKAVREIFRVTKDYFICVEQNYNGNEYTFVHDYRKIFSRSGGKIIESKKDPLGLDLFLIKVN